MRSQEDKDKFISMRVEGKSYSQIQATLGIAKATCTNWENEFKQVISTLKADRLEELYNSYFMTKEARIKDLGETLSKINNALKDADLSQVAPEKLLDYKLKYTEALKNEYISTATEELQENFEAKDILKGIANLLYRVKAGMVTQEQANKEAIVYRQLLQAYENTELANKIKLLEGVIGGNR